MEHDTPNRTITCDKGHTTSDVDWMYGNGCPTCKEIREKIREALDNPKCENCKFWKEVGIFSVPHHTMALVSGGDCRKGAPTNTGFPMTFADDWCGDYELKEIK